MKILEILKKISSYHVCDFIRLNSVFVWFLGQKFLKKKLKLLPENWDLFKKEKGNQIELIKFEIKIIISLLINYYQLKGKIKDILFFVEFNRLIDIENLKKKSNLNIIFDYENTTTFLLGKIHNVHSKEDLTKLFLSNSNFFKKNIPEKQKKKSFSIF